LQHLIQWRNNCKYPYRFPYFYTTVNWQLWDDKMYCCLNLSMKNENVTDFCCYRGQWPQYYHKHYKLTSLLWILCKLQVSDKPLLSLLTGNSEMTAN
jgi:hypothetical protein